MPAATENATLDRNTFTLLREHIFEQRRLYFPDTARPAMEARLRERLAALQIGAFEEYLQYIRRHPEGPEELRRLLDLIAFSDDDFFRGKPQLDILRSRILPSVISRKGSQEDRSLVIWSLAADGGQEAYALGMILRESLGDEIGRWSARVHAVSSHPERSEQARQARYRELSLRNAPGEFRARHFQRDKTSFIVKSEVRELVNIEFVESESLAGQTLPPEADIVFARDFLSRFDAPKRAELLRAIHANMKPGAILFLGPNECLGDSDGLFTAAYYPNAIVYKRSHVQGLVSGFGFLLAGREGI